MKKIFVARLGFLSIFLLPIGGCSTGAEAPKSPAPQAPVSVVAATVSERDFSEAIEALGTVRAAESVTVTSKVSGRVQAVHFSEGAAVQTGEPLVTLENAEENAELDAARASAQQAEGRYRRQAELAQKGLISKDLLEEQADVLESARARLRLAQVRLDERTVRAPFSGVLGFRQVSPGALITPGVAIVTLDQLDTVRVDFSVSESLLSKLVKGVPLKARSAAYPGQEFSGTVLVLGTRVDASTRAATAQALLPNPEGLLKPGMLLTLRVDGIQRKARFAPESALIPENNQQFVWRLKADAAPEKVRVEIGAREPGWVEIVSGLAAGDQVVAEGGMHLRPGRAVQVLPAPAGS